MDNTICQFGVGHKYALEYIIKFAMLKTMYFDLDKYFSDQKNLNIITYKTRYPYISFNFDILIEVDCDCRTFVLMKWNWIIGKIILTKTESTFDIIIYLWEGRCKTSPFQNELSDFKRI